MTPNAFAAPDPPRPDPEARLREALDRIARTVSPTDAESPTDGLVDLRTRLDAGEELGFGDPAEDVVGATRRTRTRVLLAASLILLVGGAVVLASWLGGRGGETVVVGGPATRLFHVPEISPVPGDEGHLLTVSVEPDRLVAERGSIPPVTVRLTNETGRDLLVGGCLPGGGTASAFEGGWSDGRDAGPRNPASEVVLFGVDVDCDPSPRRWPAGEEEEMTVTFRHGELDPGYDIILIRLERFDGPIVLTLDRS